MKTLSPSSPLLILFLALLHIQCATRHHHHSFSVRDYGAKGDSVTLDTQAIQKTIDACASAGGGQVVFPPGQYRTGTLVLKSHIEYRILPGAWLIGSGDIADYVQPKGDHNIMLINNAPARETLRVLLDGTGVQNVTFTGGGTIEGNGAYFWDKDYQALDRPVPWISFRDATNITLRDLTLQNAPSHVLRFQASQFITLDGVKIVNHPKSPNTDGVDILDSRNVHISNCFIATGDDAICLKTDVGGLVENVVVTNCILQSDDAAIKFGTGSAGVIRYCNFTHNTIEKSRYGISLFMLEGGVFEFNRFSNLIISGGSRHKQEYPIFIDVDKKRETDGYGIIRHNTFQHLMIHSSGKLLITGRPEQPIEDLILRDITFHVDKPADFTGANKPRGNKNFPKLPTSIDRASVPATLTLAHVNGLALDNISITYESEAKRPESDFLEVKRAEAKRF